MEAINNLLELLLYNVRKLHESEMQISQFVSSLIEKVHHQSLRNALTHHLNLNDQQKQRLAEIPAIVNQVVSDVSFPPIDEKKDDTVDKAILGLIDEINSLLQSGLSAEVIDTAIIASIQKIEHYEIVAYGTALSYAGQLKLHKVEELLNETLQEEYDFNDLLTALATSAINKESLSPTLVIREEIEDSKSKETTENNQLPLEHRAVSISERTINSPGGRAGTSHRTYGTGESRGH